MKKKQIHFDYSKEQARNALQKIRLLGFSGWTEFLSTVLDKVLDGEIKIKKITTITD
jgi:hypothetical protein